MKRYNIKVCGMTCAQNVMKVLDLDIDAIGIVSCLTSPRHVDPAEARPLFQQVVKRAPKVERHWVVRGIDKAELESELTSGLACTHVQLHGHYEESDARTVKALGRKVVQVHSMKTAEFPRIWLDTDRLLLDTPGPGGGGTGKAFDRSLFAEWKTPRVPVTLAGGLGKVLQAEALKDLPNWIGWLDVNSGVEISPGIKGVQQIQTFIQTI